MPSRRIALFELEPGLTRYLSEEERSVVIRAGVPCVVLEPGEVDIDGVLTAHAAFGAVIVEGMLLERMQIAEHVSLKMLGSGDLLAPFDGVGSSIAERRTWMAAAQCRLALLDRDFLAMTRRWPGLAAGLHVQGVRQAERIGLQLAIGHLPRVEDRLLAILWWMAEVWGRVTPHGTLVPVSLTHEVLGGLVGARRPTVTLAVRELSERGALLRQDQGWLLLEAVEPASGRPEQGDPPSLITPPDHSWRAVPQLDAAHRDEYRAVRDTVARLQSEHQIAAAALHERLAALRASRETMAERREIRRQQAAERN